jgi:hypothetical protein
MRECQDAEALLCHRQLGVVEGLRVLARECLAAWSVRHPPARGQHLLQCAFDIEDETLACAMHGHETFSIRIERDLIDF